MSEDLLKGERLYPLYEVSLFAGIIEHERYGECLVLSCRTQKIAIHFLNSPTPIVFTYNEENVHPKYQLPTCVRDETTDLMVIRTLNHDTILYVQQLKILPNLKYLIVYKVELCENNTYNLYPLCRIPELMYLPKHNSLRVVTSDTSRQISVLLDTEYTGSHRPANQVYHVHLDKSIPDLEELALRRLLNGELYSDKLEKYCKKNMINLDSIRLLHGDCLLSHKMSWS